MLASSRPFSCSTQLHAGSGSQHRRHAPMSPPRRPCAAWIAAAAAQDAHPAPAGGVVKICGVTSPEDARLAAAAGATHVGMILWPKAKRSVPHPTARALAAAARAGDAQPVGVFVDEGAEEIVRVCEACGVGIAQLHGDAARAALPDLPAELQVIYVMHVTPGGDLVTPPPSALAEAAGRRLQRDVEWVLLDSMKGGSGEALDWAALRPPAGAAAKGWLLAGGLNPGNVAEAVAVAAPAGVDVSSGVCGPDGLKKDAAKVEGFVRSAAAALQRRSAP